MKVFLILVISLFELFQLQCNGQDIELNSLCNSDSAEVSLRVYKAKDCFLDILYAIVDSHRDSVMERYPPDLYFFKLSISEATSYTSVLILPRRWYKDLPRDCMGFIEVGGRSFLCCGDCGKSDLIIDSKVVIKKKILFRNTEKYDSLDRLTKLPNWEKSPTRFIGTYKLCPSKAIDLHVDIGVKLEGFKVK